MCYIFNRDNSLRIATFQNWPFVEVCNTVSCGQFSSVIKMISMRWWSVAFVHRNRRLIRDGHLDFHTAPELKYRYLCARKSPYYAPYPGSQTFSQRCLWYSSSVHLIDDGPPSSFQRRSSASIEMNFDKAGVMWCPICFFFFFFFFFFFLFFFRRHLRCNGVEQGIFPI